jgi:hypothetical protein
MFDSLDTVGINTIDHANGFFVLKDKNKNVINNNDNTGVWTLMDLATLLGLQRSNVMDQQIAAALEIINQRNETIKRITKLIEEMRTAKAHHERIDKNVAIDGRSRTIEGWCKQFGITITSVPATGSTPAEIAANEKIWDTNIEAAKSILDALNNDSQIDNVKLQNLLDKRNNSFESSNKIATNSEASLKLLLQNL